MGTRFLRRAYGRLPKFKSKKNERESVTVTAITYQKPARQVSLDEAIKKRQQEMQKQQERKKKIRQQRIERIRRFGASFQ